MKNTNTRKKTANIATNSAKNILSTVNNALQRVFCLNIQIPCWIVGLEMSKCNIKALCKPDSHILTIPVLCIAFQQAFNAATVIHHMKKLQLSHGEPASAAQSMPHIMVHSSSQNELEMLGPCCHGDELDPNGNPVPGSHHLSCSNPEAHIGALPPLRASHSEPGNALAGNEKTESGNFHSESDAHFRPSKR